ncbi:hypothetical protein FHR75_001699 [Kineococcus radiotolerans]|uniref:Uncharacterized protein n=1 Tax=Kineococcus radiotolerans TaxID=131568 RepID=A0A7W4TMC8_KINRA|nr:hypothetical protein [Kineococcus radiotolerans]MBB2900911.1 hypothetical protein [Kineococcus radiotolerans]
MVTNGMVDLQVEVGSSPARTDALSAASPRRGVVGVVLRAGVALLSAGTHGGANTVETTFTGTRLTVLGGVDERLGGGFEVILPDPGPRSRR